MGTEGRNRFRQPRRRAQDGDNAMPGELVDAHENAMVLQAPFSERGGGDMTDNSNRGPWIHVNPQNANYCRIRLLSMSMNVLTLVLIPLMILSLFILLNIGLAILCGWAFQESDNGVKLEILDTIKKGYISSQYIHVMNEALYGAVSKLPAATLRTDIHHLNDIYEMLMENIQRLMLAITSKEEKIVVQDHL